MRKELIFLVEDSLDGGYEAKALGTPIFTEAENLNDLKESIRDAIKCHFEDIDLPRIIRLHFVKEEVITL